MKDDKKNKVDELKEANLTDRQLLHFDKSRAKRYEDAHDYRSRTFDWMVSIITPILKDTKSALDVGTGTGDLVRAIKIDGVFTGVDVSQDMLEVAKEKCGSSGCFVQGDAYSLPFESESFEAVTYKYALHHLDKPLESIKEAFRVLTSNGLVVIADVSSFENEQHHQIFKELNSQREPANYEYRSIKTITGLLTEAGFKEIRVQKKDFDLILEDWLNNFYEPDKTIPLVLNSPESFRKAIKLKEVEGGKHQITLTSFVITAGK